MKKVLELMLITPKNKQKIASTSLIGGESSEDNYWNRRRAEMKYMVWKCKKQWGKINDLGPPITENGERVCLFLFPREILNQR